jgi:hypothetical protein
MVETTFYVQIEPEWGARVDDAGERMLWRVKAAAMTQKRPGRQRPGTVLVTLTVRLPEAAFRPLRPEATIIIPEEMTRAEPIEVEASDPGGGE